MIPKHDLLFDNRAAAAKSFRVNILRASLFDARF
jgi:hypothetical protein